MKFDDISIYSQFVGKQFYEQINTEHVRLKFSDEKQKVIKYINEFLRFIDNNIPTTNYTMNDLCAAREYFVHNEYGDLALNRRKFATVEEIMNDSDDNFFVIKYDGDEIDVDDFGDVEQYCKDTLINFIEWISENDPPETWLKIL